MWSEIASVKKWFELKGVGFPKDDLLIDRALIGLKKMQKSRVNKKKPIKVSHLVAWARKTHKMSFPKLRVRNMVMFLLGFFAGLRVAELVKLRWKDAKCRKGVVILRVRRVKGAQQKERWPILPGKSRVIRVGEWLKRWFRVTPHKARDFIFAGRNTHISTSQVRRLVKELVTESGEKSDKFSSHSLRRGGAQFLEKAGGDLQDLRAFGGWRGKYSPYEYLGSRLGAKIRAAQKIAKNL